MRLPTISFCLISFLIMPIYQATKPIGFYFDFVDCGGERLVKFSVSVTPYPALFSATQISMWVGGTVQSTEGAKEFAHKIPIEEFLQHVRASFFTDELSNPIFGENLKRINNTLLCNGNEDKNLVAKEFFQALYAVLLADINDTVLFIPLDINELHNSLLLQMWLLLNDLPSPPQLGQIRGKIQYMNTTLICVQWNLQTKFEEIEVSDEFDKQRFNYVNAFSTPTIYNSTICPPRTKNNDQTCSCSLPHHSGPFCLFQCDLKQIEKQNIACSTTNPRRDLCGFTSLDYLTMCLRAHNISLLNGHISVVADNLSLVNVKWKLTNYFALSPHVVKIYILSKGLLTKRISYYEGMENELNVSCVKQAEDKTCSKLTLESFTNYTLTLNIRSTTLFHSKIKYVQVGETIFISPEDLPQEPFVDGGRIVNETHVRVNWFLIGHCHGIIRRIKTYLWCLNEDSANFETEGSIKSLTYDCRSNSTSVLFSPLPANCNRGDVVNVQLSIATSKGFGPSRIYSFTIPSKTWSIWGIIAVSVGGFVLAALVFTVGFVYYYKTHIEAGKSSIFVKKILKRPIKSKIIHLTVLESKNERVNSSISNIRTTTDLDM